MKVYFSSKSRWHPWVSALEAAGVPISSSWHRWPWNKDDDSEPPHEAKAAHSLQCLSEASSCDVCLLFAQRGEVHLGAIAEAAAALSHDKTLFLVAPHHDWWFLRCHRNCRSLDSLDAAVQAVLAMAEGERLRGLAA